MPNHNKHIPSTLAEIDAQIVTTQARELDAIDHCQSGIVVWCVYEIARLTNLRRITEEAFVADELRRAHRRALSAEYAKHKWACDEMKAASVQAEIEKLERGQS